jgi:hypothetical protein
MADDPKQVNGIVGSLASKGPENVQKMPALATLVAGLGFTAELKSGEARPETVEHVYSASPGCLLCPASGGA